MRPIRPATPKTNLWNRIEKVGKCWELNHCKSTTGYPYVRFRKKMHRANRVAWIDTYGSIPKGTGYHGTCVLHKCDNRACVRPTHLFLGTAKDNSLDMVRKGRSHQPRHKKQVLNEKSR